MPEATNILDASIHYRPGADDVVDGDTFDMTFFYELGRSEVDITVRARLYGVDAYELRKGTKKELGRLARIFVIEWLEEGWMREGSSFRVRVHGKDDLDRWLLTVWRKRDGECLNDRLVAEELAVYKDYD